MADERDAVAALAHDLRSPLTVIELYSGVLEAKGSDLSDEQRDEYVAKIRRAVADMRDALDRASAAGGT
jgi:signal transduction histidine kinase